MDDPSSSSSSSVTTASTPTSFSSVRAGDIEPIAIIGMGLRLPAGIRSGEQFWQFLLSKGEGVCEVPSTRYNIDSFYDPEKPQCVRARQACFFQEDPAYFDAGFFSISKHEAARLDPQQRLLLEVVWECLENAGVTNWRGKDIGCYVGVFGEDWVELAYSDSQSIDRYHVLSTGPYALANRISYEYDIQGPSMTIQSGCSSSMLALHEACQGILSGECSGAIVAGCNLILSPTMSTTMSENLVISPDGKSKTFDATADGYGRGEAINAIYIKRLSDAIADGDPVRAVIRATGTNSDGKTPVITAPGLVSQEALIRKTYAKAGIPDITQTPFFECHGTGTLAGDKSEASVLAKVCQGKPTFIGAVKPNVGHSEGASGITSVIKSVLSLEHKMIAPNIYFNTPNPQIQWKDWNLRVPTDVKLWPENTCERISVNCFGIGGANAHAVLDSASSFNLPRTQQSVSDPKNHSLQVLVLSARSKTALTKRVEDIVQYSANRLSKIHDLAYTLGVRREHLNNRAFAILDTCQTKQLLPANFKFRKVLESTLIFAFTGQGAQWPAMGKNLIETFDSFKDDIRHLDKVLQSLELKPNWLLEDELCKDTDSSRIYEAEISQPATTAIQIGIINLLSKWAIIPAGVVGHSSGEIAAAYAAGALTESSAIIVAYLRGLVATEIRKPGAMAAIALDWDNAESFLTDKVRVACENSPRSVTISGDVDEVDAVLSKIETDRPDVSTRRLKVNTAYHSEHMREVGERYESLLTRYLPITQSTSFSCPLFSTVTGKEILEVSEINPRYWRENLESPVLFATAVRELLMSDASKALNPVFVEIGPHAALAGPLREIFSLHSGTISPVYLPTLDRKSNDLAAQLLEAAAECFSLGINVDLLNLNGPGRILTDLPVYPWDHTERHWQESRITRDWKFRSFPNHELLGSRVTGSTDFEPTWRNMLTLDRVPWLYDHLLQGELVFPGAAYVCMVGEAVQQLVSGTDSFSIRHIVFKSPLVLKEFEKFEMITSLKPVRLNSLADSEWFEFSITAYDPQGERWVKHSQGQVRAGADNMPSPRNITRRDRSVPADQWYNMLNRWGLSYRGPFRGLADISVDTRQQIATATVKDHWESHASRYLIHPAAIDSCLQLFSVATTAGLSYRFDRIAIPAGIEEIYVSRGSENMAVEVLSDTKVSRTAFGDALMMNTNGNVALSMTKAVIAMHEDSGDLRSGGKQAGAEVEWRPWLEMLPRKRIFPIVTLDQRFAESLKILTQICHLYTLETADRIGDLDTDDPALRNWKTWVMRECNKISSRSLLNYKDSIEWALLDSPARTQMIDNLAATLDHENGSILIAKCMRQNFDSCVNYMDGKCSPLECLVKDGLLQGLYGADRSFRLWENFLGLLGHQLPAMRVLEIGGGTGAATSAVLNSLRSSDGVSQFARYTFTDILPEFIVSAKERFAGIDNIEFKRLDITKDVEEQGYEPYSFDLIIASNVIHATPNLKDSLKRVRNLISPNGYFLLHELDTELPFVPYICGVLSGWWAGKEDGRVEHPFVSPDRWNLELKSAGFTGIESVVHDTVVPYQNCASIISRPASDDLPKENIYLLTEDSVPEWAMDLESQFANLHFSVSWTTLQQEQTAPSPSDAIVISLLDMNGPFLDTMNEEAFHLLRMFLNASENRFVLWVTPSTQMSCPDPRYALTNGLFRALRHESPIDLTVFEIDCFDSLASTTLVDVCCEVKKSRNAPHGTLECEVALQAGTVYIPRVYWRTVNQITRSPDVAECARKIHIETYGLLDSLQWAPCELGSLEDGYVEIEVHYTALNFKDVMTAMGLLGSIEEIGLEGAGIVTQVASDVKDIAIGDRVAFGVLGALRSTVKIHQRRCKRIPDALSLEDASTMIVVYSTVFYSLLHLASLCEGQSILIHSACGGVGLAAIQVCREIGAIIYATVGSKEKEDYLVENWNIPRNHIFTSRNAGFVPRLMQETEGRGVDVVLNSLSGDLLRASWMCVAEFGKMIELGKRDLITHGKLDLAPFVLNRVYYGLDMVHVGEKRPDVLAKIRDECFEWYRQGKITAIRPVTVFPASDVSLAFRHMQQGTHMGKVVVDMREVAKIPLPSQLGIKEISFLGDASYLLVGGLGNLVYLSPSAGQSKDDQDFIKELQAQDCVVTTVAGSVTNTDDVATAIAACLFPIKGVVQLSAKLRDRTFEKMLFVDWVMSLDSKVRGTWNLHDALKSTPLDFFLMFSSTCSITGQTGQTNYAAANSFLDAFTVYRQQLGLPASIINPGVVEHRGIVSRDPELLRYVQGLSICLLQDRELVDGIRLAMGSRKRPFSPLAIGLSHTKPLSELAMKTLWARDARFGMYANMEHASHETTGSNNKVLHGLMTRVQNDPRVLLDPETENVIRAELGTLVTTYVPRAENMNAEEVSQMTLDSLMSVEVRRWIKSHLALELSLIEINRAGTVGELARVTLEHLKAKYNLHVNIDIQESPSICSSVSKAS
ncbi:fatty acid synthase S-acetyltransferase [Penicillium macrosclerotiorum]|uniref:fatty acid synthase S-acetyltransferase n=1 Tax=Penicillium macrosclerotiorum TaxID=303699 RepID=UPI0025466773|nr:fatty acid synthase S-acetyltransferase [Penicillium macrosclerotiorum]KAJ5698397.1 fatty acid synthase S-acetyltransferase [Penicillium macrosclerotiorum]